MEYRLRQTPGLASRAALGYNASIVYEEATMKLSVIMPVYNEIGTIAKILRHVRAVDLTVRAGFELDDDTVVEFEREIVIVDDGSTDGTRDILRALEGQPDMTIVYHERNRGKGAAVSTALQRAGGDVMVIQDADLEYDPRDYPALLQPIIENRSQVVYGSRFRGGPTRAMFFWHMVGNQFLTFVTNILYNTILSDMETGYKVFTREVAEQIDLRAPGWGFDPEITAQILKRGYRIYEVPISYTGREFEEGKKISWRDGLTVLWTLIKYRCAR
jgi:glycosyltransferase involved in cell wall biosynthesis